MMKLHVSWLVSYTYGDITASSRIGKNMRGSSANWNHANVMCNEVQSAYAEMKVLVVFRGDTKSAYILHL